MQHQGDWRSNEFQHWRACQEVDIPPAHTIFQSSSPFGGALCRFALGGLWGEKGDIEQNEIDRTAPSRTRPSRILLEEMDSPGTMRSGGTQSAGGHGTELFKKTAAESLAADDGTDLADAMICRYRGELLGSRAPLETEAGRERAAMQSDPHSRQGTGKTCPSVT